MKRLLVRFLVSALLAPAPCPGVSNEYDYDFDVMIVDIINPGEFHRADIKKFAHDLKNMTHEAKEGLCVEAKKLASLDGFDAADGKIYHEIHYKVQEKDGPPEKSASITDWLLRCETIPRAYLCLGEACSALRGGSRGKQVARGRDHSRVSNGSGAGAVRKLATDDPRIDERMEVAKPVREVTILLRKNRFQHEPFVMNSVPVAATPQPCSSDGRLEMEAKRYTLYPADYGDVCVAAKKHLIHDTAVVELKKRDLEKQQPFEVLFAINNVQRLIAIDCRSVPPMFVHFKERIYDASVGQVRPIDVIWVRTKPVRVPDTASTTAELHGTSAESTPMDE